MGVDSGETAVVETPGTNMTAGTNDEHVEGGAIEPVTNTEGLNMTEIAGALAAVAHGGTPESLEALMRACDNDVDQQATNVLVACAELRNHQFTRASWDDTTDKHSQCDLLHRLSQVHNIERRLAALEGHQVPQPTFPFGTSPDGDIASINARLSASEAQLADVVDAIRRHGGNDEGGMSVMLDRINELRQMRVEALARRLEERLDEVDGLKERLEKKFGEGVAALNKQGEEMEKRFGDVVHQNRVLRNLLIAFMDGDLTHEEMKERLRAIQMI
ncbi:hypothetical protein N658DRAFT_508961 [Parathielavia hyrcaniae]|uniref:Uncharacterized protein n=1 Tax=Parathielavia hyrcaniae TaxID=113614 RepID=A0AAN6SZV2_9PEZI|nr:hypothetical protein N658DRAFT_508961 [Parathielavia hyrcaniae]